MRNHAALVIALAVVSNAYLPSQGPDPESLPADTQVVVHFDVQACARVFGKDLIESRLRAEGGGELIDVLDRAERKWGFDPLRDTLGVTLYGSSLKGSGGPSFMLWMSDGIDKMVEDLRDAGALELERHGGVRLGRLSKIGLTKALGFDDDGDRDHEAWIYVRKVGDQRAVLVGEHVDDILASARVLEGEAASLADANHPAVWVEGAKGAIAFLELGGPLPDLMQGGPASAIAKKVQGLRVDLVEDGGELQARAVLEVESEEDARAVSAILSGLIGLASLGGESLRGAPEIVKEMLPSIECSVDGTRVTIHMSLSSKTLRQEIQQHLGGGRRNR